MARQKESVAVHVNYLSRVPVLVSGDHHVVLQCEVSRPGPRQVEHVLFPLEALRGDPVHHDNPRAAAAGVQSVPGLVEEDLSPVVGSEGGQQ